MNNWKHPSQLSELKSNDVHVWLFHLNCTPPYIKRFLPFLDDAERDRSERFVHFVHRKRFIVSHGFMRSVLALYLKTPAESLIFSKGEHGKPFLADHAHLHFNLSHSADIAMLAVSLHEVGMDVEYADRKNEWQKIVQRFYTHHEQSAIATLPEATQREAFFQVWARKESVMKVTGQGLYLNPSQFTVSVPPQHAALMSMPDQQDNAIHLQDIILPDFAHQYCACVAVNTQPDNVLTFLYG